MLIIILINNGYTKSFIVIIFTIVPTVKKNNQNNVYKDIQAILIMYLLILIYKSDKYFIPIK